MRCWNYLTIAALFTFTLQAATATLVVADERPDTTIREVYSFDQNDTEVKGLSMLVRTDKGVSMTLATTGLAPGAYTVWWAINPPAANFPFGFATSHVVGPSGEASFAASLKEGPLSQRGVFEDARNDEIHIVVRYHGPVDVERLHEQLGTFEADTATNVQFSVHAPPPLN